MYEKAINYYVVRPPTRVRACAQCFASVVFDNNITVLLSSPEKNVYYNMAEDNPRCPNIIRVFILYLYIYIYVIWAV